MKNSGDKIIRQQVDNMQVSFDKEAAWMRLQDRLESKDEKKGGFRLGWMAAAVLLLATVLWYSLQVDIEQPVVKESIKQVTIPAVEKQESVKENIVPLSEEPKVITTIAAKKKIKTVVPQQEELLPIKEVTPEPVVVQEEIAPIKEIPKIVSAPKPKMKVVHINEVMQDKERARIMRDIYVIEEQIQKNQRLYDLQEEKNTPRSQNPFKTNHIIQN